MILKLHLTNGEEILFVAHNVTTIRRYKQDGPTLVGVRGTPDGFIVCETVAEVERLLREALRPLPPAEELVL